MPKLRPKLQSAVRRKQKMKSYMYRKGKTNPMTSMKRKMASMFSKRG